MSEFKSLAWQAMHPEGNWLLDLWGDGNSVSLSRSSDGDEDELNSFVVETKLREQLEIRLSRDLS